MSLLRASRRKMMTKKIARLMDINVFIFVSHVFDAFLALCLNDNRDNRDNSLVGILKSHKPRIVHIVSIVVLNPQARGKTKKVLVVFYPPQ